MKDAPFLLLLAAAYGLTAASSIFTGVFFVQFQRDLDASTSQVSLAVALPVAVLFLGGPVYGACYQFLGFKKCLILASFLITSGFMLTGVATSVQLVQLFFGLLLGTGGGLYNISSFSAVADVFTTKRALANSVLSMAGVAAAMCLAPVSQLLVDMYSWRWTMLLVGALLLNAIPAVMMANWFYEPKKEAKRGEVVDKNPARKSVTAELRNDSNIQTDNNTNADVRTSMPHMNIISSSVSSIGRIRQGVKRKKSIQKMFKGKFDATPLRDVCFVCFMISTASCSMAGACPSFYMVRYQQDIGIDDTRAVWLFSLTTGLYMFACPLMGLSSSYCRATRDQTKHRKKSVPVRVWSLLTRADVLIVLQFVLGLSLLIPTAWETYEGFLAYAVCCGIVRGFVGVMPVTVIADLFGTEKLSILLGYRTCLTGIFTLSFPPLIGALVDTYSSFKVAQYVCCALSFLSSLLTFATQYLLNRRRRSRPQISENLVNAREFSIEDNKAISH